MKLMPNSAFNIYPRIPTSTIADIPRTNFPLCPRPISQVPPTLQLEPSFKFNSQDRVNPTFFSPHISVPEPRYPLYPYPYYSPYHWTIPPYCFPAYCQKHKRNRTAFSQEQLMKLEEAFQTNKYVVGVERHALSLRLGLSESQVKVWFQNRRTKLKRQSQENQHCSSSSSVHVEEVESCEVEVESCEVESCEVESCEVESCEVESCEVESCEVESCEVESCEVESCEVESGEEDSLLEPSVQGL